MTGLGLFIARGLVTAMGGRICVYSREGEGSRSRSSYRPLPPILSPEAHGASMSAQMDGYTRPMPDAS